jgi:hypothetical protein
MPTTYEPIATSTFNNTFSTISFTSIPSSYTDLRIVVCGNGASVSGIGVTLNSLATNIYSFTELSGNGTTVDAYRLAPTNQWYLNYATGELRSTRPMMFTMDLLSYTSSRNKSAIFTMAMDYNNPGWSSIKTAMAQTTAAITSIQIAATSGINWNVGRATLYGILRA